jgi:hypothetical protein
MFTRKARKGLLHSGSPAGTRNLQTSQGRSRVRTRYRILNVNGMERIMAAGKFFFWRRNDQYSRYDRNDRYGRYGRGRYHR